MLNGRLYRAAFLPFLLALVIAAFSLSSSPAPLTSTLAPDAFEGAAAFAELNSLAREFPDRRPGSPSDAALAAHIVRTLRGLGGAAGGGFAVHTRRLQAQTAAGSRALITVIAQRPGSISASPLLIVAHRDAASGGPARAELSGTAALLQLARVFAARQTQRSITLVSTSGGSSGEAAALDFAAHTRAPVDAAIVLGDVAGTRRREPSVVPYSNALGSAPLVLERTVDGAIRQEAGSVPGSPSALGQLAHLAFPFTVGEQGALNAAGVPAVLVQVSGERGPEPDEPVSEQRLEGFGRGVLRAVDALDAAPDIPAAAHTGVLVQRKSFPAWALGLLVATLLLPALVAVLDGLARARRRGHATGRSILWVLSCALPFFATAVFARVLGASGLLGAAPPEPVAPGVLALHGHAAAGLTAVGLALALCWLLWPMVLRRLRLPVRADVDAAGLATAAVLVALALLVAALNPFAALLLLPAAHLWLLLAAPELRPGRVRARLALVALALAPLALLIAFYARELGLGPGRLAWAAVLLLAGGHVGIPAALLWSIAGGCAAAATMLALAAPRAEPGPAPPDPPMVSIRGPLSYAGPGSLGGTESALRR